MGKGKEGVKTTPEDRGEKGTAGGRRDAEEVAKKLGRTAVDGSKR